MTMTDEPLVKIRDDCYRMRCRGSVVYITKHHNGRKPSQLRHSRYYGPYDTLEGARESVLLDFGVARSITEEI